MGDLTKKQIETLTNLRDWKMPKSFADRGWPGFPERSLDLRSLPSLQKLGLVECGYHQPPYLGIGIWWRITDLGRAALASHPGTVELEGKKP